MENSYRLAAGGWPDTTGYLIETAREHIEGGISIEDVKQRIDRYYQQHPVKTREDRIEEADKVSVRSTEILSEQTFTFSPTEYLAIHRRLFQGIYADAGKIRDYNITKLEWVLNGETVLYASAANLEATLNYDFQQEKAFSYKGLGLPETVQHIAGFISSLWRIHPFGEGNTRTTAIFLIKYLRKLGFANVNNELFAGHSWYFRNALVRANYENLTQNIYATQDYLLRFFGNLLLGENHRLKNRDVHIHAALSVNEGSEKIIRLIAAHAQITIKELAEHLAISTRAVDKQLAKLKADGRIERIGAAKGGYWKVR